MEKVTKFVARDDKEFDTADEALKWEKQLDIEDEIEKILANYLRTGRSDSVIRGMVLNATGIRDILNKHIRRIASRTTNKKPAGWSLADQLARSSV